MNSNISQQFAFLFIFIATVGQCDHEKPVKEINYQLEGENLHSRQTGHHGDSLIIGSQPQPEKSRKPTDNIYRCSRAHMKLYDKQYEIKVQNKTSKSYQVKPAEEYFMYIVKEVWSCFRDSNTEIPDFMRIVNEVISRKEIYEVKFYDGIEVGTRNYESADKFSTVIREIKYVNGNKEVFKFEGSVFLLKDNYFHEIPNFIKWHYQYIVPQPDEMGYIKDKKEYTKLVQTPIHISDSGISLRIGTMVTKEIILDKVRKDREKFICRREGDVSQFSPIFLPVIQREVTPEIYADVKDEDFFKYFMVVERKIYICLFELMGFEYRLLRIVNDVIGLIQIKDIYYLGGIDSLYSISVPNGGVSVRFKEIRYKWIGGWNNDLSDPHSSWPEYYVDTLKFEEHSLHSRLIMDGSIDMTYLLTPVSVFRTLIGSKGFDLRVGATYENKFIGDETSRVECFSSNEVKYTDAFNTVVRVKMNDDFLYTTVPVQNGKESSVYKVISREVLVCSNTAIKFLRILNKIEVLVPVHEIETYDGVEIVGTVLDNGSKSIRILEKKYLNSTSYRPIMYVGKIRFRTSENAQATLEARCIEDTVHKGILPAFAVVNKDNKIIEPMKEGDLNSKYFTTEMNKVFLCTNENKESKIGKFWRIVTTQKLDKSTSTSNLIGKSDNFPIGAVHIQFGKDDLEFTYREIRYMDHTFSKLMDYNGKIVVPNNKQPETLKSGTEPISNSKYEEILFSQNIGVERIKYRVNYYKSTINENGACLELGSKWQKKIEQPLTIICHQDPTLTNKYRQFNTRIVLREVSNGEYHNIIFGNYFGNLKREVWTCTDEKQQNKRIWRVVNQFKVKPGKMNAIKELYYYDGLSITLGKIGVKASLEIIEVKYLDPSNLNVLSYGEVQLSGEAASNSITISPSTLEYPVKRDFHYTLGKNELRKKVLDSEGVIILEIGQKVDEHVKNNHEGLFCEHHESDGKTSMLMRPIIVIYKLDGDGFLPVKMDERMFSDYFELVPRVWKCKGGIQDIYRVKNLLKKKCQTPVKTQSNKIAQVYYRDGITISKDEDIVTVEEIKYVSDLTENYKLLKFDGFMTFKDSARTIGIEATTPLPVRDMHNYLLDSEIVDVAGPYGCRLDDCPLTSKGAIFEIVSHRKKEIEVTHNFVTCEREEDAKYKKEFGMKVYGYLKTKADTEWSRQVVDIRNSEDFEGIAQETWTCKRDGKQIFYKVKNYMVVVGELARLYYSDGISVNWLVLPDGSKNVEIEEVKLVDSDTFETLKYDGELRFVSKAGQRIMQKFFPFDCEGQSLTAGREAENYWSLNAIRVLASRKRTVSNIEQKKGSLFEKKSLPFNMRFVPGTWRGTRVVRVGTKWEDEYNPTTIPKCMLYDGNKEYRSEYIPKIVEYYDDKWYEFDEDTFHFYFDLKQQDLWFCVTDEEVIFRIVSTFELLPKPIVGDIKLLALHEGVNLEPIHWRSRRRTNLSETVFINPINNKHLKYVGELRHIVDATKLEPSKNAPKTAIAGWYAKEYLDDLKRKTTGKFKSLRQALLLD